jgi:hypothetical protein
LNFRVDGAGLSVSGEGSQNYRSSLSVSLDMTETESLPACWSIYRASHAGELANTVSLDVRDMTRCLDAEAVKGVSARFVQNRTLSRSGHERRANIVQWTEV